jgi:hypothetical protein
MYKREKSDKLGFNNDKKPVKRADELIMANKELVFQREEKGKRANELIRKYCNK